MAHRFFSNALFMAALFAVSSLKADELAKNVERFKVPPSPVFQSIHHQPLADILRQVAQRSGIAFKIDTDLAQDRVEQSISATSWQDAVQKLLSNHNYTVIEDHGKIKTVIVSGHKNDGINNLPTANGKQSDRQLVLERKQFQLPDRYKKLPAGSVMPINLPIDSIINTPKQSSVEIELPVGRFDVMHDDTVHEPDGSKTWIGHLNDEGLGYRVFLSHGPAGVMGSITTPDTKYSIEPQPDGTSYLLDLRFLTPGGYEGDTRVRAQ